MLCLVFLNHHKDREELYQCIKAYGLKKDISEVTYADIAVMIEEVGGWDIPDRLKDLDVSYKYLDDNNKSSQNREKYNHSVYKNIEADFLPIEIWLVAPIARIAAIKLGEKADRKEKECPELAAPERRDIMSGPIS